MRLLPLPFLARGFLAFFGASASAEASSGAASAGAASVPIASTMARSASAAAAAGFGLDQGDALFSHQALRLIREQAAMGDLDRNFQDAT